MIREVDLQAGDQRKGSSELAHTHPLENTNPHLIQLAEFLVTRPRDFDRVFRQITAGVRQTIGNASAPENVRGALLEAYVRYMIERSMGGRSGVETNPIPDGEENGRYLFKRKVGGGIEAIDKERLLTVGVNPVVAEYDTIFIVDKDLPTEVRVVGEVKSVKKRGRESFASLFGVSASDIGKKLDPLVSLWGRKRFGFMAVGLSDTVVTANGFGQEFADRGGVMVPLPISLDEIEELGKRLQPQSAPVRSPQIEPGQTIFAY